MWRESLTQEQDAALKLSQKKDAYKTADKAQYKGRFDFAWRNAAIRYKHRDRYGRKCRKYGGIYPINEYPGAIAHPRCRCVPIPVEDDDPRVAGMSGGVKTATKYRGKIPGEKGLDIGGKSGIINYAKASDLFLYEEDDIPASAPIMPEQIAKELEKAPIGREIIEYIENNNVAIRLNYEKQWRFDRGQQIKGTNYAELFMSNIDSVRVAAQTVIHEVTHIRYGIGDCQWAEAVCMAQEKKFLTRRDLTFAEKRKIVQLACDNYPEYNWKRGGYKNGKCF